MNCLIDVIGLTGCGASSPVSGLFIESLPGINLESIEKLSDAEQQNYVGVWSDVQLRASKRFATDVRAAFNKRYKLKTIVDSIDLGKEIDTTSTTAAAAQYRGLIFDLDKYTPDTRKNSALQSHYIQTLRFYAAGAYGATTIKVYDIETGAEIDSITATLAAGWNTIQVNEYYTERKIFVGINSTAITSVELEVLDPCDTCNVFIAGGYMTIGADISTLTETDNSYGMSAVYGVHCKYDAVVCNNLSAFYLPLWYVQGSELQVERKFSSRINKWTINQKQADELKSYYDVQYEQALAQAVDGIDLDLHDYCLVCNQTYRIVESHL